MHSSAINYFLRWKKKELKKKNSEKMIAFCNKWYIIGICVVIFFNGSLLHTPQIICVHFWAQTTQYVTVFLPPTKLHERTHFIVGSRCMYVCPSLIYFNSIVIFCGVLLMWYHTSSYFYIFFGMCERARELMEYLYKRARMQRMGVFFFRRWYKYSFYFTHTNFFFSSADCGGL